MKKVICLILILTLFAAGCQLEQKPKYSLARVGTYADDGIVQVGITLMDGPLGSKWGKATRADGVAVMDITNRAGEVVYKGQRTIKKEDFKDMSNYPSSGTKGDWTYSFNITEIKKSTTSVGNLNFKIKIDNQELSKTTKIYGLPVLDAKEITNLNNKNYEKNAQIINKKQTKGPFEVEIKKVGFYTPYIDWEHGLGPDFKAPVTYFRVDFKITNTGEKAQIYEPDFYVIDSEGKKHLDKCQGVNCLGAIYMSASERASLAGKSSREGFVLYILKPETENVKIAYAMGYDQNNKQHQFNFDINLQ